MSFSLSLSLHIYIYIYMYICLRVYTLCIHTYIYEGKCYHFTAEMGGDGWESFLILCDGDWKRCLHPDGSAEDCGESRTLAGPDETHNLTWNVGRQELDRGQEGDRYRIELAMRHDGTARSIDWRKLEPEPGADARSESSLEDVQFLTIRPGSVARVHGLVRTPALNGEQCLVEEWDPAVGRWMVRLRTTGEVKALGPDNLEWLGDSADGWLDEGPPPAAGPAAGGRAGGLREGDVVRVLGLSSARTLNGQAGTLEEWDPARGRWVVGFANGVHKALKPENLELEAEARRGSRRGGARSPSPAGLSEDERRADATPLGAFLGSGRTARHGEPRKAKPRLGIDLRPSLPRRGASPEFQRSSVAAPEAARGRRAGILPVLPAEFPPAPERETAAAPAAAVAAAAPAPVTAPASGPAPTARLDDEGARRPTSPREAAEAPTARRPRAPTPPPPEREAGAGDEVVDLPPEVAAAAGAAVVPDLASLLSEIEAQEQGAGGPAEEPADLPVCACGSPYQIIVSRAGASFLFVGALLPEGLRRGPVSPESYSPKSSLD